ncbi:zinc finger BED domain-containing protein RICESLEEPER 2-like [Morus notabilis]|uniref:zinc finger BED domain-containing protein RICESLEEPER 2-like n=1 Tax=Morus notabilis TaxID=981085 RepID=UPI000CECE3C2|nr:zinc finger BED domain-containing protein RICESLEEPER 2-like [Morus notabilis]
MEKVNLEVVSEDVEGERNSEMRVDLEDDVFEVKVEQSFSANTSSAKPLKKTLKSKVWKFFDILPLGADGKVRSACKKCGQQYLASSKYGTGNMSRHIKTCKKRDTRDIGQMLISRDSGTLSLDTCKFDSEKWRELVASCIIMHDLPFQFVEYKGLRAMLQYLYPDVELISRNTAKAICLKMYEKEKAKIKNMVIACPGRISLTSDLWSSLTSDGYLCLTAHFVDKNWKLQKRILNFCNMPPPHTGIALSEKIYSLLHDDWGIEGKIFTITLDNATSNDVSVVSLQTQLNLDGLLPSNGEFFHLRCCAHILNLIVQDGLKRIDYSVENIRDTVKYVKASQMRKQKFIECVKLVRLNVNKGLCQDVVTRWNSTYLMLDRALFFRRAFQHLELSDSNYKHHLSSDE